ncbi:MAG: hypothetical protein H7833_00470 [Magnetococcus sp. DMHC-1]
MGFFSSIIKPFKAVLNNPIGKAVVAAAVIYASAGLATAAAGAIFGASAVAAGTVGATVAGALGGAIGNTLLNGVTNALNGQKFFSGWGNAAIMGGIGGGIAGYAGTGMWQKNDPFASVTGNIKPDWAGNPITGANTPPPGVEKISGEVNLPGVEKSAETAWTEPTNWNGTPISQTTEMGETHAPTWWDKVKNVGAKAADFVENHQTAAMMTAVPVASGFAAMMTPKPQAPAPPDFSTVGQGMVPMSPGFTPTGLLSNGSTSSSGEMPGYTPTGLLSSAPGGFQVQPGILPASVDPWQYYLSKAYPTIPVYNPKLVR